MIGEGGDTTIPSPGRSPKQPLPGIGLQDPLHGRQACPEYIQLIPPGSWSDTSPVGAIIVPSRPKTGTNLFHPLSPPIVGRVGGISILKPRDSELFVVVGFFSFHRGAAGDSNVLSDARVKNRSKTSRRSPAKKLPPQLPISSTSKYYQTYPVLPHGLLSRKANEENRSKGFRVWKIIESFSNPCAILF